jgi:hypothetical protein
MQHRIPDYDNLAEPPFLSLCHDSVKAIYRYWYDKRDGRRMPSRQDIDPLEMKSWLSHLILVDVLPEAPYFVYRLVGTGEVAQRRRDPTGKPVAEAFFAPEAKQALMHYQHVADTRNPFFWNAPYSTPTGRVAHDDILFLPLSEDGEHVNMVMVFTYIRIKDLDAD